MPLTIATFYKFLPLDPQPLVLQLRERCEQLQIKGTILLATEGINATVSGSAKAIEIFLTELQQDLRFQDLDIKFATTERSTFDRLKVKIKPEIVTLGRPDINPADRAGTYVSPQDWNQLIQDPEVLVIDTRNGFEITTGSFQGAIDPAIESFRQFPQYVEAHLNPSAHKKVAMFCTGGIRCEKASAYMLSAGFETVYHLQGGILKYLEEVPIEESLWDGECFVFDQRTAVQHGVQDGNFTSCLACGHPLSPEEQNSTLYAIGLHCPHCHDHLTPAQRASHRERQKQRQLQADRAQNLA